MITAPNIPDVVIDPEIPNYPILKQDFNISDPVLDIPFVQIDKRYRADDISAFISKLRLHFSDLYKSEYYNDFVDNTELAAIDKLSSKAMLQLDHKLRETKIRNASRFALIQSSIDSDLQQFLNSVEQQLRQLFYAIDLSEYTNLFHKILESNSISAAISIIKEKSAIHLATENTLFDLNKSFVTWDGAVDSTYARTVGKAKNDALKAIKNWEYQNEVLFENSVVNPNEVNLETLEGSFRYALAEQDRILVNIETELETSQIINRSNITIEGIKESSAIENDGIVSIGYTEANNVYRISSLETANIADVSAQKINADNSIVQVEIDGLISKTQTEINSANALAAQEGQQAIDIAVKQAENAVKIAALRADNHISLASLALENKRVLSSIGIEAQLALTDAEIAANNAQVQLSIETESRGASIRKIGKNAANIIDVQGIQDEASITLLSMRLKSALKQYDDNIKTSQKITHASDLSNAKIRMLQSRTNIAIDALQSKADIIIESINNTTNDNVGNIRSTREININHIRNNAIEQAQNTINVAQDNASIQLKLVKTEATISGKVAMNSSNLDSQVNNIRNEAQVTIAKANKTRISTVVDVRADGDAQVNFDEDLKEAQQNDNAIDSVWSESPLSNELASFINFD